MKIYTRTGDKGATGLVGGSRGEKDDVRVECYGTFDEVNATLGLLRSKLEHDHSWQEGLKKIQVTLMSVMSHLGTPSGAEKPVKAALPLDEAAWCEGWIDELEKETEPSRCFLLPGGTEIASLCHIIRTQVRRGERRLVSLMKEDEVHSSIPEYVNRLSDLFFALARAEMFLADVEEEKWRSFIFKTE